MRRNLPEPGGRDAGPSRSNEREPWESARRLYLPIKPDSHRAFPLHERRNRGESLPGVGRVMENARRVQTVENPLLEWGGKHAGLDHVNPGGSGSRKLVPHAPAADEGRGEIHPANPSAPRRHAAGQLARTTSSVEHQPVLCIFTRPTQVAQRMLEPGLLIQSPRG